MRIISATTDDADDIRDKVRAAYASTATGGKAVINTDAGDPSKRNKLLGYGDEAIGDVDLGLGCGNPLLAASLNPGDIVVDLGSGAGMDCFLAAAQVGASGQVIGVDMTSEMLSKARGKAKELGVDHVSFRLGEIENLPVADNTADCVISNCVINLSPDKDRVFREVFRVLRPGGRIAISDILRTAELPDSLKTAEAYACWVSGASPEADLKDQLKRAGFGNIKISLKENAKEFIKDWMPGSGAENYITSAYVTASKPRPSNLPQLLVGASAMAIASLGVLPAIFMAVSALAYFYQDQFKSLSIGHTSCCAPTPAPKPRPKPEKSKCGPGDCAPVAPGV